MYSLLTTTTSNLVTLSSIIVPLVLIFVLIILNGVFAASEIALVSVNINRVELDAELGNKKAQKVLKFTKNQTAFLSTIQIGITLIGLINGMFAADAFSDLIMDAINLTGTSADLIRILIMFGISLILAYFQVVIGELVPKKIGMKAPEKTAYTFVGFLSALSMVMKPFVWLLTTSANLVGRMLGLKPDLEDTGVSEEEIRLMVAASGKKGSIDIDESEMIHNIFEFDDTTVDEVMTHRTEIVAIDVNVTKEEIINYVVNERYTRYPIYEGNIDNIIGTLHVKDLIRYIFDIEKTGFTIKDILREPYYVPDSKKTNELMKEMKSSKNHIAVVIDEYGGTAGIITIEDLIEEIIGDIEDEYDEEEEEIEIHEDGSYIFDGLIDLDEVEDLIKVGLPIDEYDTLGGFVIGQIGRFPDTGEEIIVIFNNYEFTVLGISDKVITKIKVELIDNEEEPEEKKPRRTKKNDKDLVSQSVEQDKNIEK